MSSGCRDRATETRCCVLTTGFEKRGRVFVCFKCMCVCVSSEGRVLAVCVLQYQKKETVACCVNPAASYRAVLSSTEDTHSGKRTC